MISRVYFGVFGRGNISELKQTSGASPDIAWSKGDTYYIDGKTLKRPNSRWIIGDIEYTSGEVDDKIALLIERIADVKFSIETGYNTWSQKIVIVIRENSYNVGLELKPTTILSLSAVNVPVWFDFYGFGEDVG